MGMKKGVCLLLACIVTMGCLAFPAGASNIEEGVTEITERRATGHFDFEIPANTLMRASTDFPMEYGETVTIRATYSPAAASVDFGLIDSDSKFHYERCSDGAFEKTIRIDERGTYTFAIRNNSSYAIHVSGFVNY